MIILFKKNQKLRAPKRNKESKEEIEKVKKQRDKYRRRDQRWRKWEAEQQQKRRIEKWNRWLWEVKREENPWASCPENHGTLASTLALHQHYWHCFCWYWFYVPLSSVRPFHTLHNRLLLLLLHILFLFISPAKEREKERKEARFSGKIKELREEDERESIKKKKVSFW